MVKKKLLWFVIKFKCIVWASGVCDSLSITLPDDMGPLDLSIARQDP